MFAKEFQITNIKWKCFASTVKELKAVCSPNNSKKFEDLVKEIRDYFRPDNQPKKKIKTTKKANLQNEKILKLISLTLLLSVNSVFCHTMPLIYQKLIMVFRVQTEKHLP
jgi:hypothetical protein